MAHQVLYRLAFNTNEPMSAKAIGRSFKQNLSDEDTELVAQQVIHRGRQIPIFGEKIWGRREEAENEVRRMHYGFDGMTRTGEFFKYSKIDPLRALSHIPHVVSPMLLPKAKKVSRNALKTPFVLTLEEMQDDFLSELEATRIRAGDEFMALGIPERAANCYELALEQSDVLNEEALDGYRVLCTFVRKCTLRNKTACSTLKTLALIS